MANLNVNFLTSGKQFINNKLISTNTNQYNTNELKPYCPAQKCAWSAKSLKSENFYQITSQVKKYKNSNSK